MPDLATLMAIDEGLPPHPPAAPPDLHPDTIAWLAENPWFFADPELQAFAIQTHHSLLQTAPNLSVRQNLDAVLDVIRLQFPGRILHPPAVEIHPDTFAWVRRNDWFFTDTEAHDAAQSAHVELLHQMPGLSVSGNLWRVTNMVRQRLPGRFSDHGLVFDRRIGEYGAWFGEIPVTPVDELVAARPFQALAGPKTDDWDVSWLMPIGGVPDAAPIQALNYLATALREGATVCFCGSEPVAPHWASHRTGKIAARSATVD